MSYEWAPPATGPCASWTWVYEGNFEWSAEVHDEVYDGSCESWEYDTDWGSVVLRMGDLTLSWNTDTLTLDEAVVRLRAAAAAFDGDP